MKTSAAIAALISLSSLAGFSSAVTANEPTSETQPPNIIFMIGDGMGFEFISAYRYAISDINAGKLESTPFDELLSGAATTYPDDNTWVTDSASSATALATGVKSYNGAIGMDADKHPQQSIMELVRDKGWLTGAVSTSQITHATPASFFTHHPSRNMYNQIADSFATQRDDGRWSFDLLLGGGYAHFNREDKNWLPELQEQGMTVVTEFDELPGLNQLPAMGLFAPIGLPHAIDDQPRLATMTEHALRLLSEEQHDKPFALMIEGSQIDWCGHSNDIACAVHEVQDFANAVAVVREFQQQHPNTLLVITADHSTGGLTLGRDGVYEWLSERVMGIKASVYVMSKALAEMPADQWREYVTPRLNLPLTDEHWQPLMAAAEITDAEEREDAIHAALVYATADLTGTGWTTSGHTAVDVPIMATGPHAEKFRGYMDNTEIGKQLLELVR
ncbi:alkaline phosphatase [Pseudidiomarina planktonica]|uniref:Alkaline phosphatase n=1 Tax=Pseudidiomarina planktonica TaxID=1323738 RepID=A0A1Y6G2R4_9GAMM|nr:alkaline phosphatase [Pseudidiomarina planktonica]RUO64042.1 alkaline phosphatase [Pseudidiomarina planktonica]SMQ79855.1 alkaline phosphatase [Pseudidiomarina planktonica]